jgi:hypothetical protein
MLGGVTTARAQTRILFVGNSFTHGKYAPVLNYNAANVKDENYGLPTTSPRYEATDNGGGQWSGIPGIFKKLTDQAGLNYEVHLEALAGKSLEYHYNNALAVIAQPWDKVVLQELSTGPIATRRGGARSSFYTYSTRLEQAVHQANAAAQLYLYETWARADMTYPTGAAYAGLPIDSMAQDLRRGTYAAFANNGKFAAVAPAGDAWLLAINSGLALPNPYKPDASKLNLWGADNYHPSKYASYLNACVLLYTVAGVDPRSLGSAEQAAKDLAIAATDAVKLQQLAYQQATGTVPTPTPTPTPTTGQSVTSLTLINADTDQPIAGYDPLPNNATLNLADLPTRNLNLRANTNPTVVGSVRFNYDGNASYRIETQAPYAIGSDALVNNVPDYNAWTPAVGNHTLTVTPYTQGGAAGTAGTALTLAFTVTNNATTPTTLRTPDSPANPVAGLDYAYYQGTWSSVAGFATASAVASGTVASFSLSPRLRDDNFAFRYTGYVSVPTDGVYTFYTSSDDGSQLSIGSTVVVNNDGPHGAQERSGQIGLSAGLHAITVGFFEQGGDQVLNVSYAGPSLAKSLIPAAALFRATPSAARSANTSLASTLVLYPNPARSATTLTGAVPGSVVYLLDAYGRVMTQATTNATGTATLTLPAGLPSGVYVVRTGTQALQLQVP